MVWGDIITRGGKRIQVDDVQYTNRGVRYIQSYSHREGFIPNEEILEVKGRWLNRGVLGLFSKIGEKKLRK